MSLSQQYDKKKRIIWTCKFTHFFRECATLSFFSQNIAPPSTFLTYGISNIPIHTVFHDKHGQREQYRWKCIFRLCCTGCPCCREKQPHGYSQQGTLAVPYEIHFERFLLPFQGAGYGGCQQPRVPFTTHLPGSFALGYVPLAPSGRTRPITAQMNDYSFVYLPPIPVRSNL